MNFVPIEVTGGSTNGKRVLFSIWDTRVQDYEEFDVPPLIIAIDAVFGNCKK